MIGVSGPKGQKGEDSVAKEKGDPSVISALRTSQHQPCRKVKITLLIHVYPCRISGRLR